MKRITRPNVSVDESMENEIGGEFKHEDISDKRMHLILNGPTLNGVNKDTLRVLVRVLYEQLKVYEDTGLTPEDISRSTLMLKKFSNHGLEPHEYASVREAYEKAEKLQEKLSNLINWLPAWINVNDRLPEIKEHYCSDEVIVCTSDGVVGIDHLEQTVFGGYVFTAEKPSPYEDSEVEITYWMPLPEPPKVIVEY